MSIVRFSQFGVGFSQYGDVLCRLCDGVLYKSNRDGEEDKHKSVEDCIAALASRVSDLEAKAREKETEQ